MKDIVDKAWLLENYLNKDMRIIDCRFNLGNPKEGKKRFLESHIPHSIYFDLEQDLSAPVKNHGGRHPLPEISVIKEKLERAGIGRDTIVVAYDNGEGAFAARMWWLLTYLGHDKVYVLNGGYKAWVQENYPTTNTETEYERAVFPVQIKETIIASYEEVYKVVQAKDPETTVLIDSREYKRYKGEWEPIDKKAGHIPGAINKVWTEGIENGCYLSKENQKKRFNDLDSNKTYIIYCGSGVTATPNYLALKMAGFKHIKLYTGSFSDWISYDDNKVEAE
ncbi:MAG: sulfurtransferase [Bacillus sp. (in: firmicutes)]